MPVKFSASSSRLPDTSGRIGSDAARAALQTECNSVHIRRRSVRRQRRATTWNGLRSCPTTSSQNPASFTPGRASASPLNTRGGSRIREIRMYGSVRGASSNGSPYRDPHFDVTSRTARIMIDYDHRWLRERESETVELAAKHMLTSPIIGDLGVTINFVAGTWRGRR